MESNGKYYVSCIVDNMQPEIKAMQERNLRGKLLCELEEVIYSGEMIAIKVTREERPDIYNFCNLGASRITYTASITTAREIPVFLKPTLSRKTKGRNHRKKDRARARLERAKRRKYLEGLKR